MSTQEQIISKYLDNAPAIIRAASASTIPLAALCAVLEIESLGRNIFGNDAGGVFGLPFSWSKWVTPDKFAILYDRVVNKGEKSNGVGPMQITDPGLIRQAKEKGYDLSDPEDNIKYGLTFLEYHLNKAGGDLGLAASHYNAGGLAMLNAYGRKVLELTRTWEERLTPATPQYADKHTVVKGDILWKIAAKYGTTVSEMIRVNPGVDPARIYPGQVLTIGSTKGNYVVSKGDTLWIVYKRTGVPVAALREMNPAVVGDVIYPNQKLKVS